MPSPFFVVFVLLYEVHRFFGDEFLAVVALHF